MVQLLVRNRVKDFDTWLHFFDGDYRCRGKRVRVERCSICGGRWMTPTTCFSF